MFALIVPAIALAESENEANEGTDGIQEKQTTATAPQTEQEGSEAEHSVDSANSNLILFVTAAAIASVVGYSTWKVFKAKRRAASKSLV